MGWRWTGPNHDYLYVANGDAVYRRKLAVD
jgi:hypothetical protein